MGIENKKTNKKFISYSDTDNLVIPAAYIDRILQRNNDSSVIFTDNSGTIKDDKSVFKEVIDMSNGSFDTFFQELKTDMREREERSRREISEREERFKEQMNYFVQDSSKREERFTALVQEIKSDMRESEKRISENIFNSEQRINDTEKRLQDTMTDLENTMRNIKNHNIAINIALFVGMLAIVITLIIAVFIQN